MVERISSNIKNLTSLRVLSLMYNQISDLPLEISEMGALQILKVADNILFGEPLKEIVDGRKLDATAAALSENERETAITIQIKRYLRERHATSMPQQLMLPSTADQEQTIESVEAAIEAPKPLKRALSSRFPVIPSNVVAGIASDTALKSPSQSRAPPIPQRSHYRVTSNTNANLLKRPGIAPYLNGSDRNRSNSEGLLQASILLKNKRMGLLRKEKVELESMDEQKNSNRLSHLRGFSHGSALKSRSANSPNIASSTFSNPGSPKDARKDRSGYVRRLSSLPEHKRKSARRSPVVEGAKGVLYALFQVNPQIQGLIGVIKGKDAKRSSLEQIFFNASSHVERLNQALEKAEVLEEEDVTARDSTEQSIQRDCTSCIMSYTHIATQLQHNVSKIVSSTDTRYVRTLMLQLYGSMIELKNAIIGFGVDIRPVSERSSSMSSNELQMKTIKITASTGQTVTPTRARPNGIMRPMQRYRSDTTIQHPALKVVPEYAEPQPQVPAIPTEIQRQINGTTFGDGVYHGSAPSFSTISTFNSSFASRSRSNSRNTYLGYLGSSATTSIANTPRSGESFALPPPPQTALPIRVNPLTNMTEAQEEAEFEKIYLGMTRAYESALIAIPTVNKYFARHLEVAEDNRAPKEVRDLWQTLIWRCKHCVDLSEQLQKRLKNMRLKAPTSVGLSGSTDGRQDRTFWQLCKSLVSSFVELVQDMKEAKGRRLISQDIVHVLRPVQKSTQAASKLIDASPWGYLADNGAPIIQPLLTNHHTPYTSGLAGIQPLGQYHPAHFVHQSHPSSASASNASIVSMQMPLNGASPLSAALPATPLSAALGPAAQATVPTTPATSTPASAYGDQFFSGNVFQRADSLLNMPQAGSINFVTRR